MPKPVIDSWNPEYLIANAPDKQAMRELVDKIKDDVRARKNVANTVEAVAEAIRQATLQRTHGGNLKKIMDSVTYWQAEMATTSPNAQPVTLRV